MDEIDEPLVPKEMLEGFSEYILIETMLFDDEDGTESLEMTAKHPKIRKWILQILLKDGESVFRKLVERENE
ncbi:hypothetical protein [Metabacillus fastidiosus]|uniref:hypothetical protein n=1 Tax=Metabacillus fastidiosus TaxID=1458 RepID=UPI002E24C9CC|nr:hypothetical protein [Metabacillus fastidiosus]